MSAAFECGNLSDLLQIRQLFFITSTEKLLYLSIGSVDLLISVFNIVALVTLRPLKQPPSDILLVLTIYSIIKILLIYIAVIYDDNNPPSSLPSDFHDFCLATGFIEIAARIGKGVYTIILTFLYANKVKNPLKAWAAPKREIHFICGFLIILISTILYFTNSIGMTIYGYCGIAYTLVSVYFQGGVDILYLLALIGTTVIFLRNLRSIGNNNNKTMKYFFNYYLIFLIVISTNQIILTVAQLILAEACRQGTNYYIFSVTKIMVNTCSCSLSIFVLVAILANPQFRNTLSLKLVSSLYDRSKKWIQKQRQNIQINQNFYNELLTTNRKTLLVQLQNVANLDHGYLANLRDKSRACFLSSVLGCFSLQYLQIKRYQGSNGHFRTSAVEEDTSSLFSWNFTEKYNLILTSQIVQHYHQIFIKKLPPVSIKFTSYSPNVLYTFQTNNKLNVLQSLSPLNNQKAIAKDCGEGGDGGSSGQFFFFNYDRTVILKTISSKQRMVFLERLQYFYKHFKTYPQSLITKIYSVASVVNIDNQNQISFSLMSNIIGGIDQKYIIRSYDMKGSLHKREALEKGQEVQNGEAIKKTLKDVDFQRLQQKVWVCKEDSDKLKVIIKIDSQFLCCQGLIDYSLLVIKLDAESIAASASDSRILKQISHYRSQKEEGIVYVMGIIDYLQTWNIRKKGQKWYKSLFTQKNTISSQNPNFYSSRFIAFSQKILNVS